MGKRSSTAAADVTKKAKKAVTPCNLEAPIIGEWDRTKFLQKDLCKSAKNELLKDDPVEVEVPGLETTPTPPAGFR
jgi:hypothetical protein